MKPGRDVERLIEIMAALRDPDTGCPWDKEQDFSTIAPYTVEEAHEVAEAIASGDMENLREELGDLLLQIVYHARMAEEAGLFAFPDVVEAITAKMIRRHPHVFGDEDARAAGVAKGFWEKVKAEEKADRAARKGLETPAGALAGVSTSLPAAQRAVKLQDKAARVGFDWPHVGLVFDKIQEEIGELKEELDRPERDRERITDELGDVLFALANVARHAGIDPDQALRRTSARFERRFGHIEERLAEDGRSPAESDLEEMERLWQEAKTRE